MAVKSLEEPFVHALSDIHSAKKQLTKAPHGLATLGRQLGCTDVVELLGQTLADENSTDPKAGMLAEQGGANAEAAAQSDG